jgi:hypothetical protein
MRYRVAFLRETLPGEAELRRILEYFRQDATAARINYALFWRYAEILSLNRLHLQSFFISSQITWMQRARANRFAVIALLIDARDVSP